MKCAYRGCPSERGGGNLGYCLRHEVDFDYRPYPSAPCRCGHMYGSHRENPLRWSCDAKGPCFDGCACERFDWDKEAPSPYEVCQ